MVGTFINRHDLQFSTASVPVKFIYINIAVFIVVKLFSVALVLCGIDSGVYTHYLELPSSLSQLAAQPWTLITYMFLHFEILHILFNMLVLYWFGKLFMQVFNVRQFVGLYILGGLGGALLYLLFTNLLPYFHGQETYLLGASASILAIIVATAIRMPGYRLNLLLIGSVSLKWIALIMVFIDLISIDAENSGGHVAHLGGAAVGLIFGYMLKGGMDITSPLNGLIDFFVNTFRRCDVTSWFKRKPKIKIVPNQQGNKTSSQQSQRMTPEEEAEIDVILDKIKRSGYSSLSTDEKRRLFEKSNRNKSN